MANQSKTLKGKFTYNVGKVDPWLKPNKNNSEQNMKAWKGDGPDGIVFHWSAGNTLSSAITTLRGNNLSYHFLLDKNGDIIQTSPINQRTSHAGFSWGPRGNTYSLNPKSIYTSCNDYMIGICLVYYPKNNDKLFTQEQLTSVKELIVFLQSYYDSIKYVTTHFEISPSRKPDIYFWGKLNGGSTFGHQLVTSINAQHNLNLKFWQSGQNWIDKDGVERTFEYATTNGLGGLTKQGKRLEVFKQRGELKQVTREYTKEKRNANVIQVQKDMEQQNNSFSANDVLGE